MQRVKFLSLISVVVIILSGSELLGFYDPSVGKFLSRDPLEEQGGVNLYAFCNNDPINNIDYLGAATILINNNVAYWEFDDGSVVCLGCVRDSSPAMYGQQLINSVTLSKKFRSININYKSLLKLAKNEPGYFNNYQYGPRVQSLQKYLVTNVLGLHGIDRQYALLAKNVYLNGGAPQGWSRVRVKELSKMGVSFDSFMDTRSGFYSALYKRDNTDEYVLAFRGTQELQDWTRGNIPQGLGAKTAQYEQAKKVSSLIVDDIIIKNKWKLTLTGHSLGGGLASSVSIRLGVPTVVFNPAAVHRKTVGQDGRSLASSDMLITRYIVGGEVLDHLQHKSIFSLNIIDWPWDSAIGVLMPDSVGRKFMLKHSMRPRTYLGRVDLHLMDAVLEAEPIY